jgi:hydrogenase nickel incorporation protein HypA/HybF
MHEYSLVEALLAQVEREARARHATAVHRVTVRIGAVGGVEPTLFRTAFEARRQGTLCRNAELEMETEAERWICSVCGEPIAAGSRLACSNCGWPARLAGGDALTLERVELEVPGHV